MAAVAATSAAIAKQALKLIKVDYEVLPHVIDVVEAMQPDAPLLHEDMITAGVEPAPKTPSNVAKRVEFALGDIEAGFKQADLVDRALVHDQAGAPGLHRAARLRRQRVRGRPGRAVGDDAGPLDRARPLRAAARLGRRPRSASPPSEIGGGFGGKTVVYLEPLALALSKKSGRPVKMVMTREEVFRASGPTSGAHVRVKIGARKDGRIVAAEAELKYQAGAFPGSPVQPGCMCAFAPYDLEQREGGRLRRGDATARRWRPIARRAARSPSSRSRA